MPPPSPIFVSLALLCSGTAAFAWGEPHGAITKAAVEALPAAQRAFIAAESAALASEYCLIPDHVFSDRKNAKFAQIETRPGEVYLTNLHLPATQTENFETLRYFVGKSVNAMRTGDLASGARYAGTVCHLIEDYGSPAHTLPGDNMFTLLQQFLPPPPELKHQLLHGPIENGELNVDISGYEPHLLGTSVKEASWRLLHRIHEAILNARSTTIPIIQALYAGDKAAVSAHQMRAAACDAQVVADALYTITALGQGTTGERSKDALHSVALGSFFPLEAENLYYSQKQFSGAPNWGHAQSGFILAEGKTALPLVLRVKQGETASEQTFSNGISPVMGKSLTFLLPRGVYKRFTVRAGLHPVLGKNGKVEFAISGDGKPLVSATVSGSEPAQEFVCDVTTVTELQLQTTSRGEGKSQYAIWAEPTLEKDPLFSDESDFSTQKQR